MRIVTAAAAALLLAAPAGAATLQEDFNAAQALLEKGDAVNAANAFRSLLRRMPNAAADPSNRTVAVIRSGLGQALLLTGNTRAALTVFDQALPAMPDQTPDDRRALASVWQYVGRIHEVEIDTAKARAALQRSLALKAFPADHDVTLITQVALARVTMFDDPVLAARTLDEALPALHASLSSKSTSPRRDILGEVYALRGRVELNRGAFGPARDWYQKALDLAGGLSRRISVADTRIRSDMAIVHHLLGKNADVPRYLAYTGAARGKAEDIGYGADTPLPACGALTGIQPDDMAIVEFGIGADGRVVGVQPVYATRPAVADEFARAVSRWSWRADAAAALDPFWRAAVRIELRCSNAGSAPKLVESLRPTVGEWLKARQADFNVTGSDAEALPLLRRELDARVAKYGENSPQAFAILQALTENAAVGDDRLALLRRAAASAEAIGAPAAIQVRVQVPLAKWAAADGSLGSMRGAARPALIALIARLDSAGPEAAPAAAFARMELARTYERSRAKSADELYRQVVAMPPTSLPDGHPIRQTALLQLASNAAAAKRDDEAAQLAQATGLTPEQCALADVRPVRAGGRISTADFPMPALNWGLNGFVEVSYDIGTDGRPVNARTVMAYPPFAFSEATPAAVEKLRFQPFAAVGSKLGCVDRLQRMRFFGSP
ncbi:hypothetical protein ACFOMD_00695 [Sphingoaurantiacus capsulatus]|uniref:TonB C-terminal domain-containing protein n=1 Tax=Sphingoaurantiacus capsulatus TaxID=1771310 RepID=A0ABV7X534_9SPHN